MTLFSIIIGFRNRDFQRIKNSLNSLSAQTIQNFEVLFVDYGSDLNLSTQIKPIVENYSNTKYIYNNSVGQFWSRAHAFNTGIKIANGKICILWDIDLMVEPKFLEQLLKIDYNTFFTTHRCYYLPETATIQNYKSNEIINKSVHNYVGLCAVNTKLLQEIEGFDEYYQVWGAEDDDLYFRLKKQGLERKHFDAAEIPVYHQWHPTQAPTLPDMWYLKMVEKLFAYNSIKQDGFGMLYTFENRPALQAFVNKTYVNGILSQFDLNTKTLLYNDFILKFNKPEIGKLLFIDFRYPQMNLNPTAQRIISGFNNLMLSSKRNFRLTNKTYEENKILQENIYSFFKYFVGTKRSLITDYYLDWHETGFTFVVIKNKTE